MQLPYIQFKCINNNKYICTELHNTTWPVRLPEGLDKIVLSGSLHDTYTCLPTSVEVNGIHNSPSVGMYDR